MSFWCLSSNLYYLWDSLIVSILIVNLVFTSLPQDKPKLFNPLSLHFLAVIAQADEQVQKIRVSAVKFDIWVSDNMMVWL